MFARKSVFSSLGRPVVLATVAALALTAVEPSLAFAGSAPSAPGLSAGPEAHGITDVSARRRVYRGGGGGAAAAAAFAGIVGTGIAIAAAQNNRSYYDSYDGYYGGAPAYGGPVYYGGGPYYGGYGGGRGSQLPYARGGYPNAGW
jgi:hypothetical protein